MTTKSAADGINWAAEWADACIRVAAESARQCAADDLRAAHALGRDDRAAGRPYGSPAPIYSPADLAYDDGYHGRPYIADGGFDAAISPAIRAACRAYDRIR